MSYEYKLLDSYNRTEIPKGTNEKQSHYSLLRDSVDRYFAGKSDVVTLFPSNSKHFHSYKSVLPQ